MPRHLANILDTLVAHATAVGRAQASLDVAIEGNAPRFAIAARTQDLHAAQRALDTERARTDKELNVPADVDGFDLRAGG